MMITISSIAAPFYARADQSLIDVTVTCDRFGVIPMTLAAGDETAYLMGTPPAPVTNAQLFANPASGSYGCGRAICHCSRANGDCARGDGGRIINDRFQLLGHHLRKPIWDLAVHGGLYTSTTGQIGLFVRMSASEQQQHARIG